MRLILTIGAAYSFSDIGTFDMKTNILSSIIFNKFFKTIVTYVLFFGNNIIFEFFKSQMQGKQAYCDFYYRKNTSKCGGTFVLY